MSSSKKYRIGHVARSLGVNSSAIRFWESEFDCLPSRRSERGQRLYTDEDIKKLKLIKYLLHDRKLTIEGVRRQMAENGTDDAVQAMRVTSAMDGITDPGAAGSVPAESHPRAENADSSGGDQAAKNELASVEQELRRLASAMLERAALI